MKIGIITDIHENTEMLNEALRLASVNNCDELVCLGDIVGFDSRFYRYNNQRSAKTCVNLIRANCRWIVPGNHDLFACGRMPLYSNGFIYPEEWPAMNSPERKRAAQGKVWCYEGDDQNDLDEDEILFLKSLPEYIVTSYSGINCLFSHYIFPDLTGSTTRYIERKNQMKEHWDFMNLNNVYFSFIGHSHNHFAGFAYKKNGSLIRAFHSLSQDNFNLGKEPVVIMLPPLSGEKGRTGFSIIDTVSMKLNIVASYIK